MIKLYKKKIRNSSTEKAEYWLTSNGITFKTILPNMITEELVYSMLEVSNYGFKDILVSRKKAQKRWENLKLTSNLNEMTTQKMVNLIAKNPQLLKNPIIFDERILLSGFNADEIRAFLPRSHRIIV